MRRFASDRVQSIMRTLGFNDETALESKMVSRTIEGAQTRVEGFNFDTRKHVVQYDDVINRQRETIYHERERILRSDTLAPTVLAMLEEEVRALVIEHTAGEYRGGVEPRRAQDPADDDGADPGAARPGGDRRPRRRGRRSRPSWPSWSRRPTSASAPRSATRGCSSSSGWCSCA